MRAALTAYAGGLAYAACLGHWWIAGGLALVGLYAVLLSPFALSGRISEATEDRGGNEWRDAA